MAQRRGYRFLCDNEARGARMSENLSDSEMPNIPAVRQGPPWLVISFVFAIFCVAITTSPAVVQMGFFGKAIAVILGAFLGMYGARIGEAFRRFTAPDAIYTTGGASSVFLTKLFWLMGPQLIGMFIGVIIGQTIITKL